MITTVKNSALLCLLRLHVVKLIKSLIRQKKDLTASPLEPLKPRGPWIWSILPCSKTKLHFRVKSNNNKLSYKVIHLNMYEYIWSHESCCLYSLWLHMKNNPSFQKNWYNFVHRLHHYNQIKTTIPFLLVIQAIHGHPKNDHDILLKNYFTNMNISRKLNWLSSFWEKSD